MKNGGVLALVPGETGGHIGMTLENALVFNIIEFSDQGQYICKASNVNGEASNSTIVKVAREFLEYCLVLAAISSIKNSRIFYCLN